MGVEFDSTKGYPGEGHGRLLEQLHIGHNARGLTEKAMRDALLTALRATYGIVALTETHAKPAEENLWATAWGTGNTYWSSAKDGSRSRGVALLLSDAILLEHVKKHVGDGTWDGRFLAVEATVYRTCKVLFIVTYAPVASDAADNEAFHLWVKQQVTTAIPDHGQRCIIWHGDHNVVSNRALDEHPPAAGAGPPHRGAAALNAATHALGVADAFRELKGTTLEFTRVPIDRRHKCRRLDRTFISQKAFTQGAPQCLGVWHLTSPLGTERGRHSPQNQAITGLSSQEWPSPQRSGPKRGGPSTETIYWTQWLEKQ